MDEEILYRVGKVYFISLLFTAAVKKFFGIGTLYKVWFIQDSFNKKVWFRQVSMYGDRNKFTMIYLLLTSSFAIVF